MAFDRCKQITALILGAGINISYIYGLSVANGGANIVMKTDDQDKTVKLLAENNITLLKQEDL